MQRLLALVLLVAVIASAVALSYSRDLSRRRYSELETLYRERDAVNIEWGRLKLEQATFSDSGRIEKIARENLGLTYPSNKQVVVVSP
jgi:cell division protein FtsL